MRKYKGRSFKELMLQNKRELLNDQEALDRIEERIEKRAQSKLI